MDQESWSGNLPEPSSCDSSDDPVEEFRRAATRVMGKSLGREVTRVEAEILFAVASNRARVDGTYLQDDD